MTNTDILTNAQLSSTLSSTSRTYIYDLVCSGELSDADIEDYCNYEANGDKSLIKLIHETFRACKVFKVKCTIGRIQLPPPSEITFDLTYDPAKRNPVVRVVHTGPYVPVALPDDDLDTDDD